ncbi:hypothetical protein [Bacillus sp. P14.5]|uniref:hypothetical protein n=1 Tax=Bacillus sp. P14.5 TaxID=1983400 RepID=UPI001965F1F3|nr:hypothetical protein [Bacillus sp. P14.5]
MRKMALIWTIEDEFGLYKAGKISCLKQLKRYFLTYAYTFAPSSIAFPVKPAELKLIVPIETELHGFD